MSWAEVKHALNSTLGSDEFMPLDKIINYLRPYSSVPVVYDSAGSYEYTVPDGVFRIAVSAAAGGGGGGDYASSSFPGGGGGGGEAVFNKILPVTPGQLINISIGSGGAAGSAFNRFDGRDGGNTVFGSYFTLSGGKGGKNGSDVSGKPGEAGGEGGGKGGTTGAEAECGITGGGGGDVYEYGGGGSLGNGGSNLLENHDYFVTPTRGGGGGGAFLNNYSGGGYFKSEPLSGADGSVIVSTYPISIQQANGMDESIVIKNVYNETSSSTSYTETELMSAYREGVESIG